MLTVAVAAAALAVSLASASAVAEAATEASRPNVVFLLADDMGWNNVGWHHTSLSLTPHLDRLALGGVRLTQHYTQRWCAPTRAALLTGRYPYNTGMMSYGHGIKEELAALPLAFQMLPSVLKQQQEKEETAAGGGTAGTSFATAHLGKWHLGFFSDKHVPAGRGFDSSFGFLLGASSHDNRSSQVSHTCEDPVKDLFNGSHIANDTAYAFDNVYDEDMYAAEATRLIRSHDASRGPLFLYMAFQNCHAPYQAPQEYLDRYPHLPPGGSQRCYNAMVSALDDTVGAIVAALADAGLTNNTVIIFTSDNGGPAKEANNLPLRGAKFGVFEGSFRTAAFVHAPEPYLPARLAGTESDALVYVGDWYNTILGLAGVDPDVIQHDTGPVPPDSFDVWEAIGGRKQSRSASAAPPRQPNLEAMQNSEGVLQDLLLVPTTAPSPRTMIVHEYDEVQGIFAIRAGDYKAIWGKVGNADWIPDISYTGGDHCAKLKPPNASVVEYAGGTTTLNIAGTREPDLQPVTTLKCTALEPCLFNVVADPHEHHQLTHHNFANYSIVVEALQRKLADYVVNRFNGTLDTAQTAETAYCEWIKRVGWVQPFDPLP